MIFNADIYLFQKDNLRFPIEVQDYLSQLSSKIYHSAALTTTCAKMINGEYVMDAIAIPREMFLEAIDKDEHLEGMLERNRIMIYDRIQVTVLEVSTIYTTTPIEPFVYGRERKQLSAEEMLRQDYCEHERKKKPKMEYETNNKGCNPAFLLGGGTLLMTGLVTVGLMISRCKHEAPAAEPAKQGFSERVKADRVSPEAVKYKEGAENRR